MTEATMWTGGTREVWWSWDDLLLHTRGDMHGVIDTYFLQFDFVSVEKVNVLSTAVLNSAARCIDRELDFSRESGSEASLYRSA